MKQVIGFKCDYCHKIFGNKSKCIKHEKHHKEIKKIINMTTIHKQEEKEVINDTSCWYINPYEHYCKVFNQKGEKVDLKNNKQSDDDYKFWRDLHLKQTPGFFAYMYECIVYAHNYRNGFIKELTTNAEEAINIVRIRFTKYSENDDIIKEK